MYQFLPFFIYCNLELPSFKDMITMSHYRITQIHKYSFCHHELLLNIVLKIDKDDSTFLFIKQQSIFTKTFYLHKDNNMNNSIRKEL